MADNSPDDDPIEHAVAVLERIDLVEIEHHGICAEVKSVSVDHKLDHTHAILVDILEDDGDKCGKERLYIDGCDCFGPVVLGNRPCWLNVFEQILILCFRRVHSTQ